LAFGQIDFLMGKQLHAFKRFQGAYQEAQTLSFAVERCHAETLVHVTEEAIGQNPGRPVVCYKRLGLDLNFVTIPFNIP
jgi:hypothetical protein